MMDNRYPEVDMSEVGNGNEEAPVAETSVETTDAPPAADGQEIKPEQVQPDFNPDEWLLNFKGQPIKPKDRQHLINLAQQGYSYSQAMEKLNKEKEEIGKAKQQYDKYAQLDQRFQSDPAFRQKIEQLFNGNEQPEPGQQAQAQSLPPEILEKINKAEQFQQTILQERADQKLHGEIEQMKKDHPDNWDADDGEGTLLHKVLKYAMDNNFPNLKAAYRDFMWDKHAANTKAQALKTEAENKQLQFKAGKVGSPGQKAPITNNAPIDFKKHSYNDLQAMALKELGA